MAQAPPSFDNIVTGALGEYPAGTWDDISAALRPLPLEDNDYSTPYKCTKILEKANPLAAASGKWTREMTVAELKPVVIKFVHHANHNRRLWRITSGLEAGDEAALRAAGVKDENGNIVRLPGVNVVRFKEEKAPGIENNGNNNNNNNNNDNGEEKRDEEKEREIERERERKLNELRAAFQLAASGGRRNNNNNNNQRVMF